MAEATERKPADSKSQDAGREGDRPEYLVEKYGSVEDQAKGYAELEKKYHQDLDTLKAEVNSLKRGVRVEDLQPHLPPADTDNQELVDFYRSPSQYRRRVVEEAKSELRQENQQKDAVQQVLTRFFSQNSDLVGQEPLLEWYVRQEDPRLDPTDRLTAAAKRTRDHITNLRKAPESRPNPQEFVDEPSGTQPRYSKSKAPTEEDLRKDFFKDRGSSRKLPPKRLPQGE